MVGGSPEPCPVFRPSVEEFSRPFSDYVTDVLKDDPNVAMFKVIPPKEWAPRASPFPTLDEVTIACPIRQHAFGKQGAYRCYLVEQKKLTAADFEKICAKEDATVAPRDRRDDEFRERAFWSSVTIRAPCYGADTPQSFFDEEIPFGWNLRDLGDLLKKYPVPAIPGVTFPMTYFGMWKAFFAWHLEDADLFSINYMHFGAGKVWYCVAPSEREKFNQMAESIFPDLHRECKSFLRHKDILLSPHVLRSYGIKYTQTKQDPGEFIVLNAGAYHSGFSLGFNCAEAVNFATEAWLPLGANASRCTCQALGDSVRISMDVFKGPPLSRAELDAHFRQLAEAKEKVEREQAAEISSRKRKTTAGPRGKGKKGGGELGAEPRGGGKKRVVPGQSGGNNDLKGVRAPATPLKKQKQSRAEAAHPAPKALASKAGASGRSRARASPKGKTPRSGASGESERDPPKQDDPADMVESDISSEGDCEGTERQCPDDNEQETFKPMAIVGEDELKKTRYFYLVKCLARSRGVAVVQWLKEGGDGLFRTDKAVWEEDESALIKVRTQWVDFKGKKRGGFKLLTLRRRILETELT